MNEPIRKPEREPNDKRDDHKRADDSEPVSAEESDRILDQIWGPAEVEQVRWERWCRENDF
jgi:hypothetical protein